jgi:hypothetical protein
LCLGTIVREKAVQHEDVDRCLDQFAVSGIVGAPCGADEYAQDDPGHCDDQPIASLMVVLESALRCFFGNTPRRKIPRSAPPKVHTNTVALICIALMFSDYFGCTYVICVFSMIPLKGNGCSSK